MYVGGSIPLQQPIWFPFVHVRRIHDSRVAGAYMQICTVLQLESAEFESGYRLCQVTAWSLWILSRLYKRANPTMAVIFLHKPDRVSLVSGW